MRNPAHTHCLACERDRPDGLRNGPRRPAVMLINWGLRRLTISGLIFPYVGHGLCVEHADGLYSNLPGPSPVVGTTPPRHRPAWWSPS